MISYFMQGSFTVVWEGLQQPADGLLLSEFQNAQ